MYGVCVCVNGVVYGCVSIGVCISGVCMRLHVYEVCVWCV